MLRDRVDPSAATGSATTGAGWRTTTMTASTLSRTAYFPTRGREAHSRRRRPGRTGARRPPGELARLRQPRVMRRTTGSRHRTTLPERHTQNRMQPWSFSPGRILERWLVGPVNPMYHAPWECGRLQMIDGASSMGPTSCRPLPALMGLTSVHDNRRVGRGAERVSAPRPHHRRDPQLDRYCRGCGFGPQEFKKSKTPGTTGFIYHGDRN